MPDAAAAILGHSEYSDMLRAFRLEFETRYLPLDETIDETIMEMVIDEGPQEDPWECLRQWVPVQLYGFISDDPHEYAAALAERWIRPGMGRMTLLFPACRLSWEPDHNVKLAWLEACADIVPARILSRIPLEGFEVPQITNTFRDYGMTDLQNLALWIGGDTPTRCSTANTTRKCFRNWTSPGERELIEEGGGQWRDARTFLQSVERGQQWIEANPPQRLNLIITLLLDNCYPWSAVQTE